MYFCIFPVQFNQKIQLFLDMQVILSYIKELFSSFFDDNLKKIWFILKGTIVTLLTSIIKPCYAFPLPQKALSKEIAETDAQQTESSKNSLINDINFTKNTLLILLTVVVGDAVTDDTNAQIESNVFQAFAIVFYFTGFLLFLSIGRLWASLFAEADMNKRRIDSWFAFEFNMLFLLIFMSDYVFSHVFAVQDEVRLQTMRFFGFLAFMHTIYFVVCLRKQTQKKLGNVYYFGVNIFLALVLTLLAICTPTFQIAFKDALADSKRKKIEQQTPPENKPNETPTPPENKPNETPTPPENKPNETPTPPENKPNETPTPPEK